MRNFIFGLLLCLSTAPLLAPKSLQASSSAQKIVTAAQVNGTWRYKSNTLKVWALGQQKLKVEFLGTYEYKAAGELMANTGSGSGVARIEGDTAIFRPEDADEECKIIMRFTEGKLIVEQEGGCGFGHNVTASGTYRKTSRSKPKFGED